MYVFQHGIIASSGGGANPNFLMTIDTTKAGSSSDTFILPCFNIGTYNAVIDWGDGSTSEITTYNDADLTHVYSSGGTYQISISGSLPRINFANSGDKLKVISIDNWGVLPFTTFESSFRGCTNLDILATDSPDFSVITSMEGAFHTCTSLTNFPFNNADFTNVTAWNNTGLPSFYNCTSLNNLDFNGMLMRTASSYNFNAIFNNCTSLSSVIGFNTLNVSKITSITDLFNNTSLTTIDLSNLDFSSCTSFLRAFWVISELTYVDVTDMVINTISNTSFQQAFQGLGVCDIVGMDTWNIAKVISFLNFCQGTTITTTEYDKLLIAWDSQDAVNSLSVNFGSSQYTLGGAAETARANLISTDLWTITDGGGI